MCYVNPKAGGNPTKVDCETYEDPKEKGWCADKKGVTVIKRKGSPFCVKITQKDGSRFLRCSGPINVGPRKIGLLDICSCPKVPCGPFQWYTLDRRQNYTAPEGTKCHKNTQGNSLCLCDTDGCNLELEPENGAISKEVELSMIVAALVLVMAIPAFKN